MRLITLFFISAVFSVNATNLDSLKSEPASKYDILKMALKNRAKELNSEIENKKIDESPYSYAGVRFYEDASQIGYGITYQAKAKYIKVSECKDLIERSNIIYSPLEVSNSLWPNDKNLNFKNLFVVKTFLVAEDNAELAIRCD